MVVRPVHYFQGQADAKSMKLILRPPGLENSELALLPFMGLLEVRSLPDQG
jgi:hypothetical protein